MEPGSKIELNRKGDVGIMKIGAPPHNYLTRPDFIPVEKVESLVSSGIKALVIAGEGRNFSAGADLKVLKEQIDNENLFAENMIEGNRLLRFISSLEIPVIAAISGVCFGAGLEIALSCDIRYGTRNSLFAFPEINHNLIPGLSGIEKLITIAGKEHAIELVLNGDMINAEEALRIKLLDEIVDGKNVLDQTIERMDKLVKNRSLKLVQSVMKTIRDTENNHPGRIERTTKTFVELALDQAGKE